MELFVEPRDEIDPVMILNLYDSLGLKSLPWANCDSGTTLLSGLPNDGSLGWLHVDLRSSDLAAHSDVPVWALLRQLWNGLQMLGSVSLAGVDVLIPVGFAGKALERRLYSFPMHETMKHLDRGASKECIVDVTLGSVEVEIVDRMMDFAERFMNIECNFVESKYRAGFFSEGYLQAERGFRINSPAFTIDYLSHIAEVLSRASYVVGGRDEMYMSINSARLALD